MNRKLLWLFVLVVAAACGRSEPAQQPASSGPAQVQPPGNAQAAPQSPAAQPAQPAAQRASRPTATAVDFEQLVALLPDASGWTRNKPRGEQVHMGVMVSHAKAEYAKDESTIDLVITDSSFNELLLSPLSMYLSPGFSERTSEGYTKSARMAGHPGFEKWNADARRAEVTVIVGNRFIVQGVGHNVDNVDPVRALVQAVELSKLAALK